MKKYITVFSIFSFCFPLLTLAHPGHGDTDGYSIIHYITEPVHAFLWIPAMILIVVVLRYFSRYGKKVKSSDPL